jgi:hydrocephalus-inducing protein
VWALPDAAQKFRDELIIMIKNNPSPVIIPLQCQGAKPQIDIMEGSPMKFTRIMLKQTTKKQLKLKNNGVIPIKFKLTGT